MGRPRDGSTSFDVSRGGRTTHLDGRAVSSPMIMSSTEIGQTLQKLNYTSCQSSMLATDHETLIGMEDALETQARASLSLFGFGSSDDSLMNWKPSFVHANEMKLNAGNKSRIVSLRERTCSLGKNAFYWKMLSKSNLKGSIDEGSELGNGSMEFEETDGEDDQDSEDDNSMSKLVQQYLVKSTVLIPATVEEMAELIVKSDPTDMNIAMQYLVGVKGMEAEMLHYRDRKRARKPYAAFPHEVAGTGSRACSLSNSSDQSEKVNQESQSVRGSSAAPSSATERIERRRKLLRESSAKLMRDSDALSNNQGTLSLKWALAEKTGRMFTSRVQYCLLDYDCVVVNDWDTQDNCGPMFVRVIQSTYLPQLHTKTHCSDPSTKMADLQPTGIMVRQAKDKPGMVEVQFVGSILEKADDPVAFRRARLRSLCLRIAKLEEIIRCRHLSQSLMIQEQPHWVRNTDRMSCYSCNLKFSLSRRRHHCRLCGDICCSDCCPKVEVELPDTGYTNVRICVLCMKRHCGNDDSQLLASSSSSPIAEEHDAIRSFPAYNYNPQVILNEACA